MRDPKLASIFVRNAYQSLNMSLKQDDVKSHKERIKWLSAILQNVCRMITEIEEDMTDSNVNYDPSHWRVEALDFLNTVNQLEEDIEMDQKEYVYRIPFTRTSEGYATVVLNEEDLDMALEKAEHDSPDVSYHFESESYDFSTASGINVEVQDV